MQEYSPICFLLYLINQIKNGILQLNARKFNEQLHKIENTLWNQHYHIDFGFKDFAFKCQSAFYQWIDFDDQNLVLTITVDDALRKDINRYVKIYSIPDYRLNKNIK